jgi:hypothetical protein
MQTLKDIFSHPFVLGLIIGLIPTALAWKNNFSNKLLWKKEKAKIENELRDLTSHLHTQLKINSSGNDVIQREIEALKSQNETLRINLAALQNKPGKSEMRHLCMTETAVRIMRERAPGFASAWEAAMREAEQEAEDQGNGLKKIVRKFIPHLSLGKTKTIDADDQESR